MARKSKKSYIGEMIRTKQQHKFICVVVLLGSSEVFY